MLRTAGHTVRTQNGVMASAGQRRGDVEIRNYMRDQAGSRSWSSTCPSHTTVKAPEATCSRTVCYRIPRTSMRLCVLLRSAKLTAIGNNQDISFLPAIVSTSTRMHGEFLRLLFLQAHRETEAHFTAAEMSSQRNQSDSFHFKRTAFYQSLKSNDTKSDSRQPMRRRLGSTSMSRALA